jgi:hypothetical protein
MQPVSIHDLAQVNGGSTITIVPGKIVVVPVIQANISVLQNGITQLNVFNLNLS